ncbi:uncharacterized protein EV420DRAFT_1761573 [Desarmillaria tabescens]|uniref:Uncharacterized protein n=1 Tax=Armillaria tabescens TaxID=1929756 RepID=A0AA39NB03_ARMTA|nr:uncharacterized protein EV420DRAFT_1761573 [Desarmillaria tabescens]KAK0462303.1 hypothetical protein EV420DRAFT_1761573 [Desarmillaria tabescens]
MANKHSDSSLKILSPYSSQHNTVDHYKEERTDQFTPSVSNDNLPFPTPAKSETDLSSTPSEPPSTAPRIRLGGTPAIVIGILFCATVIAALHHVYLSILRGRKVSGQFWIKNSSNALSTSVQWLCTASIMVSLTQLIWWFIRRRPFTVLQLNHLFGLPGLSQILYLASSRRLWNIIPVIAMATLLQALALVSILAPNSLEVGSASPKITTISVPTVFFSKSNISETHCDYYPSPAWEKVLDRALQSNTLIGWNAPVGCGTECNCTVQYNAPALKCTDLSTDEVNAMLWQNPHFPATVYNATSNLTNPSTGANMSMAWRTYNSNGESTTAGARCSLYNTTQQSVVSFVNNTGIISPSIISYNAKYHFEQSFSCGAVHGRNPLYPQLAAFLTIVGWLYNQLNGSILYSLPNSTVHDWISSTNLMTSNLFSINETARTFTPNIENVTGALEQILVNVTVALITYMGHTAVVNASVAQDQLIWVYHSQRLWIIYGTALILTAVCGVVGLVCMLKDGEDRDLTFWDIVRATRNSELDAVVEAENGAHTGKDTMLQYAVQGKDSDANTSGVFVLARSCHEES